jgi:hypothetical protein
MKVRVYYNGYKNVYLPQHRWFGIWKTFTTSETDFYFSEFCTDLEYSSQEKAVAYLNLVKEQCQKDRKREAASKERAKKSGVVYEDVI